MILKRLESTALHNIVIHWYSLVSLATCLLQEVMELRVGNKFRLGRKIGSGSFGDIYLGKPHFCIYKYA